MRYSEASAEWRFATADNGIQANEIDPEELANEQSEREQADKGNIVKLQRRN